MGKNHTEQLGIDAAIAFEHRQGRTECLRVHKCGYDLITRRVDGNDERHIEVKATRATRFSFRWLEPLEQKALGEDDRFYLYLVTRVGSDAVRVIEYDRVKLRERFSREIPQYHYVFPATDFR